MACETDSYTKRPLMSNDPYTEMTDEQIRNIKHVWVWTVFNIQFTMWSNTWVLLCLVVQNNCYNKVVQIIQPYLFICDPVALNGGSVAKWLACWTQAQKGLGSIAAAMLSVNSLRQTVHTHRASIYQAAKLVAALLRVARVTAGLQKVMAAYHRVYDSHHLHADCQEPQSTPEPYARQSSMGCLYLLVNQC